MQFMMTPEAPIYVTQATSKALPSRCTIEVSVANPVSRARTAWSFHPSKFLRELLISQSLGVVPPVFRGPGSSCARLPMGTAKLCGPLHLVSLAELSIAFSAITCHLYCLVASRSLALLWPALNAGDTWQLAPGHAASQT